jgi:hypothetical protein
MIQLPENWKDTIRVSPADRSLWLFFKNDANQYFIYYQTFDLALPFDETVDSIGARDFSEYPASEMNSDLSIRPVDALDQNWVPAPLPDTHMLSLAQYRAMKGSGGVA